MARDRLEPVRIAALVERAARGDGQAWTDLHQGLGAVVWSVVRAHRLNASDAEDVVQGVWLRLAQHISKLDQPERLPGWLATTARRECLLVVRRAARTTTKAIVADEPPDAGSTVEHDERRSAVRSALDALDPRCRELLILVANVPPLTYADVGESLAMPASAVGPTRGRCLEKLRRHRSIRALMEPS